MELNVFVLLVAGYITPAEAATDAIALAAVSAAKKIHCSGALTNQASAQSTSAAISFLLTYTSESIIQTDGVPFFPGVSHVKKNEVNETSIVIEDDWVTDDRDKNGEHMATSKQTWRLHVDRDSAQFNLVFFARNLDDNTTEVDYRGSGTCAAFKQSL